MRKYLNAYAHISSCHFSLQFVVYIKFLIMKISQITKSLTSIVYSIGLHFNGNTDRHPSWNIPWSQFIKDIPQIDKKSIEFPRESVFSRVSSFPSTRTLYPRPLRLTWHPQTRAPSERLVCVDFHGKEWTKLKRHCRFLLKFSISEQQIKGVPDFEGIFLKITYFE